MKNCSFFILFTFMLAGCVVTKAPAPIEYHHKNSRLGSTGTAIPIIGDEGEIISKGTVQSTQSEIINPHNDNDYVVPAAGLVQNNRKIIYHEVQVGETIEEIALKYEQTVDEIAMLNELYPPYYLDEFQIIKIKVAKDFDQKAALNMQQKQQSEVLKPQTPDFIPPVQGKVISKFGESTKYGQNKGINIAAKQGTKILAATGGKVIYADYDATFGYLVLVKVTGKNIVTSYAHLEDMILSKGTSIKQGDVIGYVGSTGKVKTPQLHFGIREGKTAKDPLQYVKY